MREHTWATKCNDKIGLFYDYYRAIQSVKGKSAKFYHKNALGWELIAWPGAPSTTAIRKQEEKMNRETLI